MKFSEKNSQKKIAKERITTLFELASDSFEKHPDRSHRYVKLARAISMKHKVPIPKPFKRRMCKKCLQYLQSGTNSSIRYRKGRVIITCNNCKNSMRYPTSV